MSVIIVGGGMAGATLALAISRFSHGTLPVHLIEAKAPEADSHPGFDARAIALAAGTCQQLARIGVWQVISSCATAIKTVHVSDRGHGGFVTLDAEDYRLAALGHVAELHDIGLRLFALLRQAPGVTLHCPERVASVSRTEQQVNVTLENGRVITGSVLVAADGTHSALATACGVDWRQEPYEQLAVIANVATSLPHQGRAFERFTPHGPWQCCQCRKAGALWSGAIHLTSAMRYWGGLTRNSVRRCRPRSAGGWGVLLRPVSAARIRFLLPPQRKRLLTGPYWSAMRRRRCILSPGKGLISVCAMS